MNKTTFRCIRSGNTVSFTNSDDIEGLRKHEGYVEVKDAQADKAVEVRPQEAPVKKMLKIKPKGEMPAFLQE